MKFLLLLLTNIIMLAGCGGGGGTSSSEPTAQLSTPPVTPSNQLSSVSISSDKSKLAEGDSYELSWSLDGEGSCDITGAVERTVTASGAMEVTDSEQGEHTTSIACGTASDSVRVVVIPEVIEIPDLVFEKMLTRLGYQVSNGQMSGTEALSVNSLCITALSGFYGEPGADGTVIFGNPNVPDSGVTCVYTDEQEFIRDTAGLEYFLNLRTMRLEHQQFDSLNLSMLEDISFLSLWGNPIYELELTNNHALTHLGLSETSLVTIDTSNLPELVEAAFQQSDNEVPYTTFSGTVVHGFNSLDFAQNQKLQRLYVHSNPLTDFGIADNKNSLVELWARNTAVQSLDLSGFESLRYIILRGSESLTYLNVYGVDNYTVPFRFYCDGCPQLEEVIVYDAPAFTAANGKDGVFLDDHITFVEGP